MRDDEDDYDSQGGPPFPVTVTIAGIAWIVNGVLILLGLAFLLLGLFVFAGAAGQQNPGAAGGALAGGGCAAILLGLFGGVFLMVGVQSVRGTAKDTLGNGIGSIVFGLINLASAAVQMGTNVIAGAFSGLVGLGLLAAGVLALVGRADYKAWRRANGPRRRRDEDEEDDRPRRRRREDDDDRG